MDKFIWDAAVAAANDRHGGWRWPGCRGLRCFNFNCKEEKGEILLYLFWKVIKTFSHVLFFTKKLKSGLSKLIPSPYLMRCDWNTHFYFDMNSNERKERHRKCWKLVPFFLHHKNLNILLPFAFKFPYFLSRERQFFFIWMILSHGCCSLA